MSYFDNIYGQDHLKKLFGCAFESDHLSHAYLFEGKRGVGKYAFALEVARTYLCEDYPNPGCGACRSCAAIERGSHPDLQLVFPFPNLKPESRKVPVFPFSHLANNGARYSEETLKEVEQFRSSKREDPYRIIDFEKKPNLPIEVIKDLRAYLKLKPQLSRRKAVIVLELEFMAHLAANVFLKTVEEPPPDTLIILTTCNSGMILSTIKSRCQVLHFAPLKEEIAASVLTSRLDLDLLRLSFVIRAADCSLGLAEKFCRHRVWEVRDEVLGVISDLLSGQRHTPPPQALVSGGWAAENLFGAFLWIFHDLYFLRTGREDNRLINCDIEDKLKEMALSIPKPGVLEEAMTLTSRVEERYFTLNLDLEFSLLYFILKLKDLFSGRVIE